MKKIVALMLAMIMALGLTACGSSSGGEDKPELPSKIVMGSSIDYPPFEFNILEDGEKKSVGIDISLGEQIAKDMGAEFEVVDMAFENLLTLLNQGNCDMVIAATGYREDRAKNADYSEAYYFDIPPVLVTMKGNESQYKSLDDFNGKVVAAQMATTKAELVATKMEGAEPLLLSSVIDMVNNLTQGKCDAVILDGAVAEKYLELNEDLAACDIVIGKPDSMLVWVAKGDPKGLLPSINETIAKVLEDGTMDQWIEEANALSKDALA